MIQSFKDLEIYKEAYDLAIIVNKNVNRLPLFEKNDLGSQLRRASKSVPANIAEGWAKRQFEKQFKLHLNTAVGSCNEMEVHISMTRDKSFSDGLINRYVKLGGRIVSLHRNWKTY